MPVHLQPTHYVGCVTALLLHPPTPPASPDTASPLSAPISHTHLLIARGANLYLHAYPSLQHLLIYRWSHNSQRIHGITCAPASPSLLAVWGGHHLQLLSLSLSPPSLTPLSLLPRLPDLIWSVSAFCCPPSCPAYSAGRVDLVAALGHGQVVHFALTSDGTIAPVNTLRSPDASLLYSAALCGRCLHALCAIGGGVHARAIVWSPVDAWPVWQGLAHEGSIFSVSPSTTSDDSGRPLYFSSSSDDRSVRRWALGADGGYEEQWVGWGHEARVWRVREARDGRMVSAGEDDTIRVWKDGKEVDMWRERGRKGGAWALEVDVHRGKVIAGFVDGRVRVLDLRVSDDQPPVEEHEQSSVQLVQWQLSNVAPAMEREGGQQAVEYCRVLTAGLGDDEFFLATSRCRILHLIRPVSSSCGETPVCSELSFDALRHPVVTMAFSGERSCLAVADNRGGLVLLFLRRNERPHPTVQRTVVASPADGVVVGLSFIHFLSAASLPLLFSAVDILTGDAEGGVRWWRAESVGELWSIRQLTHFRLPVRGPMTCANIVSRDNATLLLCGDSKGSLYVHRLALTEDSVAIHAISRQSGVHNSCSAIVELDDGRLLSVGKDGCLHYFDLHRSSAPPPQHDVSWLAKHAEAMPASPAVPAEANSFVLTLSSTFRVPMGWLVGVSVTGKSMRVAGFTVAAFQVWDVHEQTCLLSVPCGGHHRPYAFHVSDCRLSFVHCSHTSTSATISSSTRTLTAQAHARAIGPAFHTQLTTGVRVLATTAGRTIFATVSEDAQMKVWAVDADDRGEGPVLLRTFNDHPDSIRAMAVHHSDASAFLFSAGGKDHLRAYRLRDAATGDVECVGSNDEEDKAAGKPWLEKGGKAVADGDVLEQMDVRLMALVALPAHPPAAGIGVAVGDSAGRLRLYAFNPLSSSPFTLLSASNQHGHPVISLTALDSSLLVSGDTAGVVCWWDVSSPTQLHLLARLQLHQAGVNAVLFAAPMANDATPSSPSILLITGGDDGCLGVVEFVLQPSFALVSHELHPRMHDSAIQCLALQSGLLLTSGYDQRLRAWALEPQQATQPSSSCSSPPPTTSTSTTLTPTPPPSSYRPSSNWRLRRVGGVQLELADVCDLDCGSEGWVYVAGQGLSIVKLSTRSV